MYYHWLILFCLLLWTECISIIIIIIVIGFYSHRSHVYKFFNFIQIYQKYIELFLTCGNKPAYSYDVFMHIGCLGKKCVFLTYTHTLKISINIKFLFMQSSFHRIFSLTLYIFYWKSKYFLVIFANLGQRRELFFTTLCLIMF